MEYTILLVEDDVTQRMMVSRVLEKKLGMRVKEAANGKEALYFIQKDENSEIDLVLLDLQMPEMDGFAVLEKLAELNLNLPVIVLTGSEDLNDAVKAIRLGAVDFLKKPAEPERLQVSIQNALRINTLSQEIKRQRRKETNTFGFNDIIGFDSGLKEVTERAAKAAGSDIPVLINGETGSGKEVFARAIHGESKRCGASFVAVNCAAIPKNLVESTLFGHEKGSFTGAISKAIGKFREAEGGTLFLDEIGELPLEAQAKLLRVLQVKEIEPVGAGKPVKVNVRIISATNRDLGTEVGAGNFREDLLFRLNVLPITIPALKERKQDILPLAYHFLSKFVAAEGKKIHSITAAAEQMLINHAWSGNVRELENTIYRAVVLCDAENIEAENIQSSLQYNSSVASKADGKLADSAGVSIFNNAGKLRPLAEIEEEIINKAIASCGGNIPKAAELLGVAKSTLYRKLDSAS